MPKTTLCSIKGCDRGNATNQHGVLVCSTHRERMRRTGTYDALTRRPCTVDACVRTTQRYDQLCQVHAHRVKHFGAHDHPYPNGSLNDKGYRIVSSSGHILGSSQGEHRLVLFDAIGYGPHQCSYCKCHINWRVGLEVDHIDHDRINNDRANLTQSCHKCNSERSVGGRFEKGDARSQSVAAKSAALRKGKPRASRKVAA